MRIEKLCIFCLEPCETEKKCPEISLLASGSPVFFTSPPIFTRQTTPLTKLPSRGDRSPKRRGKLVRNWGEPQPKTGGSCARFWFQIWGDKSHWLLRAIVLGVICVVVYLPSVAVAPWPQPANAATVRDEPSMDQEQPRRWSDTQQSCCTRTHQSSCPATAERQMISLLMISLLCLPFSCAVFPQNLHCLILVLFWQLSSVSALHIVCMNYRKSEFCLCFFVVVLSYKY